MKLIFLLMAYIFMSARGLAEDAGPWDVGAEIYENYLLQAMDDPEAARQAAFAVVSGKQSEPTSSAWIQAYLYVLAHHAETLPETFGSDKKLSEVRRAAETQKIEVPAFLLRYQQERRQLQAANAKDAEWTQFYQNAISEAESLGALRAATIVSGDYAAAAYNAGSMQIALDLTQKAIARLETKVPTDDFQMLSLRLGSAMLLDYSSARDKALEIHQSLLSEPALLKMRWLKADVHFNHGLALINGKRFDLAQVEFRAVNEAAIQLKSKLLQGRGLKGLGYAQQRTLNMKAAIQSYKDSIRFMKEGHEDPVAISDAYKQLAFCLNAEKQYDKALTALQVASRNTTAMQDKVWERDLQEIFAEAYAGLGQTVEALAAARRVNVLLRGIVDDERKQELNRLKVSLGLEIEEQKNRFLSETNKAQEEKLRHAELLRRYIVILLVLSILVILLLIVALKQMLKAKKSRERVHRILEHIEEGILSIGVGMKVEADLSPYLAKILGLSGRLPDSFDSFAELLAKVDLTADERALMRSTLEAVLGEDALNWQLNQAQLPLELTLNQGTQVLSLDWQPIHNEAGLVQNVLLTVRDITVRRDLQKEVTKARAHASRLEQRLGAILNIDARTAQAFMIEAQERLLSIRKNLEQRTDLGSCLRQLHTLKGMARTLGFQDISSLAHELEDQIGPVTGPLFANEAALNLFRAMEQAVHEYQLVMNKIQREDGQPASPGSSSFLLNVAIALGPVRTMLEKAGFELAHVTLDDHVPRWSKEELDAAQVLLVHGLTNCADHGFILPARKGLPVSRDVFLTIRAFSSGGFLGLEISDNGVGLDLEKLSGIARTLGFVPGEDETIADVVFVDGASTAEQVSSSSGRGVGLAALRQSITGLNGSVHFKPNPSGQGTCLAARIPRALPKAA
jgi:HPt (histidine-containing phosphotransfer) domain-containing protein